MIILHTAVQPFFGPWITHRSIIKLQHMFLQSFIRFSWRIAFHKCSKIFLSFCIMILKKLLQHIFLQKLQFTLICSPVTRIQSDQMKIISDHIGAKAVNGSDLCRMDQRHLSLQMLIIRIFSQCLIQSTFDTFPHLSRCRPCKCHDQKTVNVHRFQRVHDLT